MTPHRIGQAPGIVVDVLDVGASIRSIEVPAGDGGRLNVALGYADLDQYAAGDLFLGGTIGRYANRIAGGTFELDGRTFHLPTTEDGNHLHGEPDGFHRRTWTVLESGPAEVLLGLVSPDGDQGFPGELTVTARYRVDGPSLDLALEATTTGATVVNLTNHVYLNLEGVRGGTIDDHRIRVAAAHYLPVDETGIPLGPAAPVAGTPFDLREPAPLGDRTRASHPQLLRSRGLDHTFILDGDAGPDGLRRAAEVWAPASGIRLALDTDQPGLQVYAGNQLDGSVPSSTGRLLRQGDGLALEAQAFPNSPNEPAYPSTVLRPGATYRSRIRWSFSTT